MPIIVASCTFSCRVVERIRSYTPEVCLNTLTMFKDLLLYSMTRWKFPFIHSTSRCCTVKCRTEIY
jgi:hypothetical protein